MSVQGYNKRTLRVLSLAFRKTFTRSLKFFLFRREKCSALLVDRHSKAAIRMTAARGGQNETAAGDCRSAS